MSEPPIHPPVRSLIERLLALEPKLRRAAARIAQDSDEADDLVQEVWLAALTNPRGEAVALKPWALAVMRNQAARRRRRALPAASAVDLEQVEDRADARTQADERREVQRHLRACVESLPDPYRATLIEHFYAARSVSEIAASRSLPRATVSTHLHRALERLRSRIARSRDMLGVFPALPWARRARESPKTPTAGGGVMVRSLALACVVTPLIVVWTWVRAPLIAAPESDLLAGVVASAATSHAAASTLGLASRRALPLEIAEPSPIRVRVRDGASSLPFAGAALEVLDEAGSLFERRTDDQGACSLPEDLTGQWLVVGVVPAVGPDEGAQDASTSPAFRWYARAESRELDLVLGHGPLVRASFATPRGVHAAELVHGLRSARPGALSSPRLLVGPDGEAGSWRLQLPADQDRLGDWSEKQLHVCTRAGLFAGEARITAAALNLGEPLQIELEPRAALEVQLRRSSREQPFRSGVVRLRPQGDDTAWIASPTADGRAWLPGMLAGEYRVEIDVPGCTPWSREIELFAGSQSSVTAELVASPVGAGATLRGRIVRARDGYDGALILVLEGGSTPQFQRLAWKESDVGFEARFEFTEVDMPRPLLRPIALDGIPRFDPPVAFAARDGTEIEFSCHGTRAAAPVVCDIRSFESDESIPGLELELELAGSTSILYRLTPSTAAKDRRWAVSAKGLQWKVRGGEPWDWSAPDSSVRWTLSAPGFQAISGDEGAWSGGTFQARLRANSPDHASAEGLTSVPRSDR